MGLEVRERLLLTIIKLSDGRHEVHKISSDSGMPLDIVMDEVRRLEEEGLVRLEEGCVMASTGQRLRMAVSAIRGGISVESACRALGWREFEDLVALILEFNGFKAYKHYRFRGHDRRFEVDVLALEEPYVLSIECKRWSRSWLRAAVISVVKKHLERTEALMSNLRNVDEFEVDGWKRVLLIPLIVALSEASIRIFDGVPIIPIFRFRNFINDELPVYLGDLKVYGV